jgi:hypothetical protein
MLYSLVFLKNLNLRIDKVKSLVVISEKDSRRKEDVRFLKYHQKYWNAFIWCSLLCLGYGYNLILCKVFEKPTDYVRMSLLGHFVTVGQLLLMGFVQGWYCEAIEQTERLQDLLTTHYFLFLYFLTFPVFNYISDLEIVSHAITDEVPPDGAFVAIVSVLFSLIALNLVWHVWYAHRSLLTTRDFLAYLTSRCFPVVFFAFSIGLVKATTDKRVVIHLHHYFTAWLITLFCAFNHPLSQITLAVFTAIYVQGLSCYSAAALIFTP